MSRQGCGSKKKLSFNAVCSGKSQTRQKKTISESCCVSKPCWDRNQEVIRKETENHTKLTLSFERGHISCAIPPFNRRHSLIQTNKWFGKNFISRQQVPPLSALTLSKTYQANTDLLPVLSIRCGYHIQGSKSENRTLK